MFGKMLTQHREEIAAKKNVNGTNAVECNINPQ